MEKPRPSTLMWGAIAAGVVAYEVACPADELLSEQCDRWIEKHPIATRMFIGGIALHLANAIPPKMDLVHHLSRLVDKS